MRLIKLLVVAAGAAYLYRRFIADSDAGLAETQAAEPYSSDALDDDGPVGEPLEQGAPDAAEGEGPAKDTLERPTWLDPADTDGGGGSAATAGDGG